MSLHFELQYSFAFPKYCKLCKCLSASRKGTAVSLQGEGSQEFFFSFYWRDFGHFQVACVQCSTVLLSQLVYVVYLRLKSQVKIMRISMDKQAKVITVESIPT